MKICSGDFLQLQEEKFIKGEDVTWIVKPSSINRGSGIEIFLVYEQLLNILLEERDIREWIVSVYIDRPLLLSGRKFHIRAYVAAVGDLTVYFYDDVLCLCSGTEYDGDDVGNYYAHITNTCYQSQDAGFNEEECVLVLEDVERILVQEYGMEEGKAGKEVENVKEQMRKLTGELFECYKGETNVYDPLEGSFEHYGFDFMVAENDDKGSEFLYKTYLLEVNPGPDFKQSGKKGEGIVKGMLEETVDLVLGGLDFDKEKNGNVFTKVYDKKD